MLTPNAAPGSLPGRSALRAAFENLGVRFHETIVRDGTKLLESTSNRAFIDVQIVGDPVHAVSVNWWEFTIDRAGRTLAPTHSAARP